MSVWHFAAMTLFLLYRPSKRKKKKKRFSRQKTRSKKLSVFMASALALSINNKQQHLVKNVAAHYSRRGAYRI
jgi:hypothetical protein